MQMRTTRTTVSFRRPFRLAGEEADLPAGDYDFIVEEELIQGLSFEAYRRTASFLMVRTPGVSGGSEMRPVEPRDLDAALERDRAAEG